MNIGFYELLCWPTVRLVEHGIAARAVTKLRFQETGHTRPLDPAWAHTFGSWGGVATARELAALAGKSVERVRAYAKERGLRYAHRDFHRTHARLAVALWCDRTSRSESCRRFGVWPGERRILCATAQVLIDGTSGGIGSILAWPTRELERRFAVLRLDISPPAAVLNAARWSMEERLAALGSANIEQHQNAKETA